MNKKRGTITLISAVILLGVLVFTTVLGWGATGSGAMKNIKLGLDLAGGVSVTYEANEKKPSAADMADTIYKLQKRVENYSTEASVYQEGDNRINIEIPGVTDANAILEELGKPGALTFTLEDGTEVLTGADVANAQASVGQDDLGNNNAYQIKLEMTAEGAEKFAIVTAENVGKVINIVYDGEVLSSPAVQQAISGGQAVITGKFDHDKAEDLAATIRIGSLKLELTELRSNVVGAQLGEDAIRTSIMAGIIGLILVILFMIFVYKLPGAASGIALMIYICLVLVIINAFDVTLTLPGIAGIILGIGMAVDANVIIFARVKEEMSKGMSVRVALKDGFSKALSAIVDGNVTTLIAAAVLWMLGSGTVKGFAQTLVVSIIVSMFTALVVTRLIVNAFYAVGIQKQSLYYRPLREKKLIDFVGKRPVFFLISLIVMVAGFAYMGFNAGSGKGAFAYSLEFEGGTATKVTFDKEYSIDEIDKEVVPVVEEVTGDNNVQIQRVADSNEVVIKTVTLDVAKREALNTALVDELNADAESIMAENISSTVSNEMKRDAVNALAIASICMLLYIWFRFKDIRFATSAIIALLHDVAIVVLFYAISRITVGNTFIAVILTIVGYSINATIVIFDRIREELRLKAKRTDYKELVNKSINQTLTRSIYTNLTTIIMVIVLYILGVSSIKEFALPLIAGIAWGTYSSVCITGLLWFTMKRGLKKK
ncbi:SecD/SecF fusion protein [Lachnospiraceae bacterium PF1-22]|uniref:protein translocase subunit SecD n=1 Tax=Ohessyouella blattaphilus TaxID=2949333 RepID=UPI003E2F1D68